MNPLAWLNPGRWLLYAAFAAVLVVGGGYLVHVHDESQRDVGRREVQAKWDAQTKQLQAAAIAEQKQKDDESLRRLELQRRNQDAQDAELAAARAAADRNARDADQLREQSASAAREWAARLGDSPSREDLQTAGAALGVCSDLLGRADARASLLASYADTARAAGLKCERDYDALTERQ